ncbi:secretory phospholipase A2 receptor-like [Cyprinodon tularosa]|uniref:secretory phospholipase A2 receptor-like n=1 Tax=Cyprinodon tularosa TaxID=77115 RepID=UPI0018E28EF5|nr:secretory phospholipase A2 receptor-like [Cyprinodon tularosa]
MEKIIFCFLILTSSCCWGEKYVFVDSPPKRWADAKDYCQENYANIVSLTSAEKERVFKEYVNKNGPREGWIGMYWHPNRRNWKWWRGGNVTYHGVVNSGEWDTAKNVYWKHDGWHWKDGTDTKSFFCLNMIVVQERKTWEDALEHCRKNDGDLISLLSEVENYISKIKIEDSALTHQVWIGMRYLGDSWMWVNGDPVLYTASTTKGDRDYQCPRLRRCGALTKEGKWESRDCEEKLNFICA